MPDTIHRHPDYQRAGSASLATLASNKSQNNSTVRWLMFVALLSVLLLLPGLPGAAEPALEETHYTVSPRFGTRKAELSAEDQELLDNIVAQWRGRDGLYLEVVGHSDNVPIAVRNRKEFANNQVLSEARASTVASYLARQLNISSAHMRVLGMGDRTPVASNATAEGRAKNRRVDVTLRVAVAQVPQAPVRASGGTRTAVLERARVLIDQGKAGEALTLLKGVESELIGNTDFDYLYGLAALESNELGEAMFALQRAVELDPDYAAARMELARAHFQTGDLPEAKRQFEMLAGQNPPATARAAINERLAMIERMQSLLEPKLLYYLKSGGGYDSNANSATALNNFLGFDLSEQSRETSSPFVMVGGGARYLRPQSRSLVFDTRLDLSHRTNFEASFVDSTGVRFNAGLRQEKASQVRSLGVQGYRQHVDGSLNSQGLGLAGQWNFKLDESRQLGVFARIGTTRYGDTLKVKDVYEYLGGVSGSTRFGGSGQGLAGVSLVYGTEEPIEDGSRYARSLYGVRAFANWIFSSKLRGNLSLGVLKADYDEIFFPLEYFTPREDTLLQGQLSAAWQFRPEWVLSPSLGYYRNSTDVQIFEFDRYELMLSVSRLW